jgi:hypothetical protein
MRHHHATTEQPCGLGGLARPILLALAVAGLAGCGDGSPMGPESSTPPEMSTFSEARADELAADLTAGGSAAAGPLLAAAVRAPRSFFVNPVTGKDTNAGTNLQPFKTLARGLSTAIAGDTMRLAAGVYSAATNGEKFGNSVGRVTVPAGVMILGTLAGDLTSQLHGVSGENVGLDLLGAATVRNLIITGFPTGIQATQGVQSFKGLTLAQNTFGLNLAGSAKATLTDGKVTVPASASNGTPLGAIVRQQAQLTMTGGTISGSATCAVTPTALSLGDAARLTLRSGATIKDFAGRALTLTGTSKATLTGLARIDRTLLPGCSPAPSVFTSDSTTLTLTNARISSTGGTNAVGILAQSRGPLTLDSTEVTGHTGIGIRIQTSGTQKILVTGSRFQQNAVGLDAGSSNGVDLIITGSTVSNNGIGIHAPFFKLRKSVVTSNGTGIAVATFSADLGQVGDPGNNLIAANSTTGVTWDASMISAGVGGIFAAGNTWNPSTQLSDANGHYPQSPLLNNDSPSARGKNFVLPTIDANDLFQIQL